MAKVWDIEDTDIVRFVLTRAEWQTLITGIASCTGYMRPAFREKAWNALEVLQKAEDDIDASALTTGLHKIAEYAKSLKDQNERTILQSYVKVALNKGEALTSL